MTCAMPPRASENESRESRVVGFAPASASEGACRELVVAFALGRRSDQLPRMTVAPVRLARIVIDGEIWRALEDLNPQPPDP